MGDSRRFDASINVNPEWGDPIETYEFTKLTKIKETVSYPEQEVLLECGKVGVYSPEFGRSITTKQTKTLARNFATERTFLKPTSSEDPNLRKFASEGVGNVFVTDSILSAIMAAPRAVYSWDLVVTKQNGQIWIDRRTSRFDAITVNENSSDPPDNNETDALNTPNRLSQEAVACQQNFSQQVLAKGQFHSFDSSSPFSSESATLAPVGYRYSVMPLGDNFKVVVRAEIDAVKPLSDGEVQHISIKTLNEYDPKVTGDWRKRIDIQRAGVLANELKNNMFKIQRWAVQALLSGSSKIEIGYLSRQQPKDATNHHILSVQSYTPQDFFTGMSVNLNQMWSIVHLILERISAEADGKYLLYKEAGVTNLKLFKIPQAAFVQTETTSEAIGATTGLQILK
jgi:translation initiation factor 3 subunit D